MKKHLTIALGASMLLAMSLFLPLNVDAGVNVNIAVPLPGLVIPAPPALMVVPGTNVYYPPDVGVDIFFYHGYWYRPYGGRWFIAPGYNGPWGTVAVERIPRVMRGLPPSYRRIPYGYERMPYRVVTRNWQAWERERHWVGSERRRHDRGEDSRWEHGQRVYRY